MKFFVLGRKTGMSAKSLNAEKHAMCSTKIKEARGVEFKCVSGGTLGDKLILTSLSKDVRPKDTLAPFFGYSSAVIEVDRHYKIWDTRFCAAENKQ